MKYLAKVHQFHVHVRVRGHVHVRVLSVYISVSMSISMLFQLNMALWIFMADTAIILSIPKGPTGWRGNLKRLSYERGWLKLANNLGHSPFKEDLLNDTTFSQTKSRWTVPLNHTGLLRKLCITVTSEFQGTGSNCYSLSWHSLQDTTRRHILCSKGTLHM